MYAALLLLRPPATTLLLMMMMMVMMLCQLAATEGAWVRRGGLRTQVEVEVVVGVVAATWQCKQLALLLRTPAAVEMRQAKGA